MRKSFLWISLAATVLALAGAGCSARMKASYHLHRAERFFNAGQYAQAEIEYKNVLRNSPANPEAWSRLGIIYCNEGRSLEAVPILAKAEQLDTNNLEVRLKLGTIYWALGKTKEAREEALFVLDRKPQDEQAPLLLADASVTTNEINAARQRLQKMYQQGETAPLDVALGILAFRQLDFKTAESFFKLATGRDPKCSDAYSALGNLYVLQKNLASAEAAFKKAADLAPVWSGNGVQYAQFKILSGDPAAGRQMLQSQLKKEPDYLPAWLALSRLAAAQTNYAEASTLLGNVLSRDPQNLEGLLLKARLESLQGKTANAVRDLEATARIYPKAPTVLYQLATAYLANHDTDQAVTSLNQALNLDPKLAAASLLLAQIQIQNGNAAAAVVSLRQLIGQQPQLVQARLLLATAYRAQGSPEGAVQIYRQLEKAYPQNADIPLLLGETLLQQKEQGAARAEFEKALQLEPASLTALQQLVNLDLLEKQYTAARQRVQQSIEKYPKAAVLQLLLGQVLASQGQTNEAEAAMAKAIQLQPDYQGAYLMLAQLYSAAHQDQKALAQLQAALARNPKDLSALMLMGMLYNTEKNYPEARDVYQKILAADPNNVLALNNLACVYADHLNQLDKAAQLARQAADLAPTDPAITDTLGWILYRQGQYAAALNLLQKSATKLYAVPAVQFHLGMAYYMMGDEAEAKAALQRALDLKQDFAELAECRQRLAILAIDPQTAGSQTRSWLEDWTAKNPGDSIALVRLAALYRREGLTDKAISAYAAAAKANPQNVAVMKDLAALYTARDLPKAISWANAAYKLSPNDPTVTHLLGRLNFLNGDYSWALTLLQLTAQARPQDPSVLYDLAEAYYSMGKVPQATSAMQSALQSGTAFERTAPAKQFLAMTELADQPARALAEQAQVAAVLKSSPDYVPALMVQAVIAARQRDLPAAEGACQTVLKIYPDFTPAQKQLAILYAQNPADDARAYALAVKAYAAMPNDPELSKTLGILVYRRGDYARAARLLQQSPLQDSQRFYYLGMAQYQLKHRAESKIALQKALALNLPNAETANAKRILAELK